MNTISFKYMYILIYIFRINIYKYILCKNKYFIYNKKKHFPQKPTK